MSGLAFLANFWWFFQCKLQHIVWTAMDRKYVSDHAKIQLSCLKLDLKNAGKAEIPYGTILWRPL